ncbi:hypothetical protein L210DRAFT_2321851 [Boletus edulis BED1]|uniref:Uncharacterized protein n=1 Tax=Boletus edulis BED1 TaxID=1328754 RepID=A0AAD4G671_BOLED|nr:hypothetical protein L210DRAFT_2321851 [Boletus edulis BED1]
MVGPRIVLHVYLAIASCNGEMVSFANDESMTLNMPQSGFSVTRAALRRHLRPQDNMHMHEALLRVELPTVRLVEIHELARVSRESISPCPFRRTPHVSSLAVLWKPGASP